MKNVIIDYIDLKLFKEVMTICKKYHQDFSKAFDCLMHTNILSLTILKILSECFSNPLDNNEMHSQDNVGLFTHSFNWTMYIRVRFRVPFALYLNDE
jgi:hypothetical protein